MVTFGAWSSGDWASSGAFWPELAIVGAGLGTGQCRWLICWTGRLIEVDPGGPFRAGPGKARWREHGQREPVRLQLSKLLRQLLHTLALLAFSATQRRSRVPGTVNIFVAFRLCS